MNTVMTWLLSREGRKWLYSVSVAAIPLLVILGKVDKGEAALWLSLIAAILGVAAPSMALAHLSPKAPDTGVEVVIPDDLDNEVDLDIDEEA